MIATLTHTHACMPACSRTQVVSWASVVSVQPLPEEDGSAMCLSVMNRTQVKVFFWVFVVTVQPIPEEDGSAMCLSVMNRTQVAYLVSIVSVQPLPEEDGSALCLPVPCLYSNRHPQLHGYTVPR